MSTKNPLPLRECGCNCGRKFQPLTRRARFIDDTHRQRAHRARKRSENPAKS